MSSILDARPYIAYNAIPYQAKTAIGALTVKEWNDIINVLSAQSNNNSLHIEKFYRSLYGTTNVSTSDAYEYHLMFDEGLMPMFLRTIDELKAGTFVPPSYLNDLLDVDTTAAVAGHILIHDGTKWVAAAPTRIQQIIVAEAEPSSPLVGDLWFHI